MSDRSDLIDAAVELRNALYAASDVYPADQSERIGRLLAILQFKISELQNLPETDPTGREYRRAGEFCETAENSANARPPSDSNFRRLYTETALALDALDRLIARHGSSGFDFPNSDERRLQRTIADPGVLPPTAMLQGSSRPSMVRSSVIPRSMEVSSVKAGRYFGTTQFLEIQLRCDDEANIISLDFFRLTNGSARTWVASARSIRNSADRYELGLEDRFGATSLGWVTLSMAGDSALHGRLFIFERLDGLPFGREVAFSAEFVGKALRTLGLEIESEDDVDPSPSVQWDGSTMSIEGALEQAGFEVHPAGSANEIGRAPNSGWSEKDIEALMYDTAQIDMNARAFAMQLLWLSRSNRNGLFGVMFDTEDDRPRQSVAVFAEEIRSRFNDAFSRDRKLLQTAVHEIGHALNLAHRFERSVGRADSHSFMNYDWRFRGGGLRNEYWNGFNFTFDDDELAFLRHGGFHDIALGGAPFHSVRYWSNGNGGYSPYVPEEPLTDLSLEIKLPPSGGQFLFGEPVLLGLTLTNHTGSDLKIPSSILDLKAGFVELLIRRIPFGRRASGEQESFHPIVARCFDIDDGDVVILSDGESFEDNMNVTFGASGFSFAEPGRYEVQALLVVYDRVRNIERIAASSPVQLFVGFPTGSDDMALAETVFSSEVGRWLALGAPKRLENVGENLLEAIKRHPTESAAAIEPHAVRAAMFGAARKSTRMIKGKMTTFSPRIDEAASFAKQLDKKAMDRFDPVSAQQTKNFIETITDRPKRSRSKKKTS